MGQKYTSISDLYKQVKLNEQDIKERKLTPQELEDREKIAKKLPMADFKKRYGKDAMAVKMATATNIVKNKSRNESINEDGHTDVASATRQCKTILEDAMQILQKLKSMSPEDSLPSWWTNKLAVSSNSLNKLRDYFLVPSVSEETLNCGCGKEICETYGDINETIPKSTMYALVKDGKVVAKGSKRDMTSKMKKEGGKIFNAPSKKVGDTMKESLDEKFTKKDFAKNEDENQHTKNAIELVKMFGTSAEDIKVNAIAARHNMKGSISRKDQQDRDALIKKYYPKLKEQVELDEKAGDIPDLKKLVSELQGASKMHLAQSKRVQAHVDMMVRADAKGPKGAGGLQDLKNIVGELEKASQAHLRQSKSIDAHVDFMNKMEDVQIDEAMKYNFMVLDPDGRVLGMSSGERQANDIAKNNLRKVRGRVVKLRKPMAQTRGDRLIGMLPADNLAEQMKPEDSLSKWKHDDAKGYAEKLIKEYGQPDEVTETMLKWNSLGSFGKGERETYIVDESIPHAFPKPHRDYVYTVMNIKVPSDMLDTLGHVTGSIIYDGLKEEVTARCGSLYANAATLGFVRDMVEGKVTTDKDGAKKEYADRITKDPLPKTYDNKMNEDVSYMCGAECVQESYQEMIARIMSQGEMR